jgi:hypothetical protein
VARVPRGCRKYLYGPILGDEVAILGKVVSVLRRVEQ